MTDAADLDALRIEGRQSTGVWGATAGAGVLAIVLAYFLYAYFSLATSSDTWPPEPVADPPLLRPALLLGLLAIGTAVAVWAGWRAPRGGNDQQVAVALTVVSVIGAAAVVLGSWMVADLGLEPRTHAYGAIVHTVHAVQGAATLAGVGISALTAYEAERLGRNAWVRAATVVSSIWWCTIFAGWVAVYGAVYVWTQVS